MKPASPAPRSQARRDDGTDAWIAASARRGRREEVARAEAFATFDRNTSFVFHGCASMTEYARQYGYGSRQTREYVAAGRVFLAHPPAIEYVLDGSMAISTVAALAPLFLEEGVVLADPRGRPLTHAQILHWGRIRSDHEIRHTVARIREEARVGAQTRPVTVHLSAQGVEDLERAQVLLSRSKRRRVGPSEAVQDTLRDWVARNDPLETAPRTRRLPPMPPRTDGTRHPRSVPAQVKRELMAEHGDVCMIEGCEHRIWLENAHVFPLALGGGNEVVDLRRPCVLHHRMYDHGELRWIPAAGYPGGGHFVTPEGRILRIRPALVDGLRPAPHASAADPPPGFLAPLVDVPPERGTGNAPPPPEDDGPGPTRDRVREHGPRLRPSRAPPGKRQAGGRLSPSGG